MLSRLIRGVTLTEKFGEFVVRRLGVIVSDFGPLLRKYGVKAGTHVSTLEAAFEDFILTGSQASFASFFRSYNRLSRLTSGLNAAEQQQVATELERRAQTLLAKQDDFGKLWATGIQEAATVGKKAAKTAASLAKEEAALNELIRRAYKSKAALYPLWKRFTQVVSPKSPFMRDALRIASEQASEIKALLKKPMSAAARSKALTGYMVKVRGPLGEGYVLLSETWRRLADGHLADARRIASQLGPDWEVHELTQVIHDIKLNGREGQDALIVLVNPKSGEAILHTAVQVKVAKVSEAVQQSINDLRRGVGQQGQQLFPLGTLQFILPDGLPQVFTLGIRRNIRPKLYVANALGGSLPAKDLQLLSDLGGLASEIQMDLSVDQMTHLAVTFMEAALKAAK